MDSCLVDLDPESFRARLPEALQVYVAAMDYPPAVARSRATAWMEHSRRPGFSCVGALGPARRSLFGPATRPLLGLVYGYRASPGQWWFDQVARGLHTRRRAALDPGFVELTELHVHPDAQGSGIGRRLLHRFLEGRPESRVLLSTPEVPGEDNRAWALYRSEGFDDVLRHFFFEGDPRPFAVLGRDREPGGDGAQ